STRLSAPAGAAISTGDGDQPRGESRPNNRRYPLGSASGRSSAISPAPASVPASPCNQTAAAAASNAGMPWARQAAAIPASTSPDPAVASQGGALSAIAARPSGAATTVSGPLSRTTAPAFSAAAGAPSSFG